MKHVIKLVGLYLIAGAACKAGEELWDRYLSSKTYVMVEKLKSKLKKKES